MIESLLSALPLRIQRNGVILGNGPILDHMSTLRGATKRGLEYRHSGDRAHKFGQKKNAGDGETHRMESRAVVGTHCEAIHNLIPPAVRFLVV